jgi:flagellar biogenesis protein FliO
MPNDYYDFNPSATTWVLMLSGMVLFVIALSLLLIYLVHRAGQATAPATTEAQPQDAAVAAPDRTLTGRRRVPVAKVS